MLDGALPPIPGAVQRQLLARGVPAIDWCQRWDAGRPSWRHRFEGGFDQSLYEVAPVGEEVAKAYVLANHYSASYPAASARWGLFRGEALVGVAVFGVPVNVRVLTKVFPGLVPFSEATELSRFVLDDQVPANAESWFLGRVFRLAADQAYRGVVSFSDPLPRRGAGGEIVMPGHVGIIYQATNATYLGRATARTLHMLPDGLVLNDRSMQKIRQQERGHGHVEARLIGLGAARRPASMEPAEWLRIELERLGATKVRHPGNHRYAFVLGRTRTQRRQVRLAMAAASYPKSPDLLAA